MGYFVTHTNGRSEDGFPLDRLEELLDELSGADAEHPDVALTHESEWTLTAYKSGAIVLENVEEGEPIHMLGAERMKIIALWRALAHGEIEKVRKEDWLPGYPGTPRDD